MSLEKRSKETTRSELANKFMFYIGMHDDYKGVDEKFPTKLENVVNELDELKSEKNDLSTQKYQKLLQLEHTGDKELEKTIVLYRTQLNKLKQEHTKYKIEIIDVDGILKKLSNELLGIRKNIASKTILQNIPVTVCPVCFASLPVEELEMGLCCNCKNHNSEDILQSLAMYKKMIEDSILEAESLKNENNSKIVELKKRISNKEKVLYKEETKYYEKLSEVKEPIDALIQEIKNKIDLITQRYYKLTDLKRILVESNKLKDKKNKINDTITELREQLNEASKKNGDDYNVFSKWKALYQEIFTAINGTDNSVDISEEDYMPSIDGNNIGKVSSESMKLVAQLSYILSLFQLPTKLDEKQINEIGFVIFDSPKDKDLDKDKYERFLNELSLSNKGQIFLTGSVKDSESYEKYFEKTTFLPILSDSDRLLKFD
jgi:DNA repair exonuclease SbcCD ATPase subunit